jgi:hypothetical protein
VDQQNSIFDGQKAWRNLLAVGFSKCSFADLPKTGRKYFSEWLKPVEAAISAQPDPEFLVASW